MSVLQTVLSPSEFKRLSERDRNYLQRQLEGRTLLNRLLHKPIHYHVLHELQWVLDRKPLPRQNPGRTVRGQIARVSNGVRYPCHTRPMTDEERIKYGVKEVTK